MAAIYANKHPAYTVLHTVKAYRRRSPELLLNQGGVVVWCAVGLVQEIYLRQVRHGSMNLLKKNPHIPSLQQGSRRQRIAAVLNQSTKG